jgi:DNA-binding GntR family transcriptional regulator
MAGHHERVNTKDKSIRRRVMDDPWQDPSAFLHIHSVLARRINGGEYPAGAKLPTETEIAGEFGCGPGVAAQALRALQRDGLARKVLWKGYFSYGPIDHAT